MVEDLESIQKDVLNNKYDLNVLRGALNSFIVFITMNIPDELDFLPYWCLDKDTGLKVEVLSQEEETYFDPITKTSDFLSALSRIVSIEDGLSVVFDEELANSIIEMLDTLGTSYKGNVSNSVLDKFYRSLLVFALNNKNFAYAKSIYEKNRGIIQSKELLDFINDNFLEHDKKSFIKISSHPEYDKKLRYTNEDGDESFSGPFLSIEDCDIITQDFPQLIIELIEDTYNYDNISPSILSLSNDVKHVFTKEKCDEIKTLFSSANYYLKKFYDDNKKYFDSAQLSLFFEKNYYSYMYEEFVVELSNKSQEMFASYNENKQSLLDFISYFGVFKRLDYLNDEELLENFDWLYSELDWFKTIKQFLLQQIMFTGEFLFGLYVKYGGETIPDEYYIDFKDDEGNDYSFIDKLELSDDQIISYRLFSYDEFIRKYVHKSGFVSVFKDLLDLKHSLETVFEEMNLDVIFDKADSINNAISLSDNASHYLSLKNYAYDLLDSTKENEVTKLYVDGDLDDTVKQRIVCNFLKSATSYASFPCVDTSDSKVNELYSKIKQNARIVNQIISGENICAPFLTMSSVSASMKGDYVFLIICQIKTIERYLKEVLVQNFPTNIRTYDKNTGALLPPVRFRNINNLSADNLSKRKYVSGMPGYYNERFEIGPCSLAVQIALTSTDNNYNGIFKPKIPRRRTSFDFNEEFTQKVRNGYLHNSMVDTLDKALELRKKVAYWFYRCIDELPPLMR